MQAVVATGGKQYKVAEGDVIEVERLAGEPGDEITLDALMIFDGADATSDGGVVTARLVDERKAKKVVVGKFKSKTGYRRKNGHRQIHTRVEILSISR